MQSSVPRRSAVYRRVSKSWVDETLFGATQNTNEDDTKVRYRITGKDTVQKIKPRNSTVRRINPNDGIVITGSDIGKIAAIAKIETDKERYDKKMAALAEREKIQKKAMERKQRILSLEETRKRNRILSDMEQEEIQTRNACLQRAQDLLAEQHDSVKEMNQMVNYAKTVTIRDAQLQEKKYLMAEKQEEEAQSALVMEIERLKACKMYETRENQRKEDQRRGAQVIVQQIKENQGRRQREEALRAKERDLILKQIECMQDEQREQGLAKQRAADALMEQVNATNEESRKIKEEKMLREIAEDQALQQYLAEKAAREQALADEKEEQARMREYELAKLRSLNEKVAAKKQDMDELRQKRAFEQAEREARQKAADEANRKAKINQDLEFHRLQQQQNRQQSLARQAQQAREEFERDIAVFMQQEVAEQKRNAEERAARKSNQDQVKGQIAAREEKKLMERRLLLEEGAGAKRFQNLERKRLTAIKQKKIMQLQQGGVPEKYWAELAKKKIVV